MKQSHLHDYNTSVVPTVNSKTKKNVKKWYDSTLPLKQGVWQVYLFSPPNILFSPANQICFINKKIDFHYIVPTGQGFPTYSRFGNRISIK